MIEIRHNSVFASVLARENIFVHVDPKATTAYFHLEKRTLVFPVWDLPDDFINMIVVHEIAHAKYTPTKEWKEAIDKHPEEEQVLFKDCLNIVEDARIDRLIQNEYPGSRQWYYKGQRQMIDAGMFKSKRAIELLSLPDRLNLVFKTNYHDDFMRVLKPGIDMDFYHRMNKSEEFEEVVEIAEDLFHYFMDNESGEEPELVVQQIIEDGLQKQRTVIDVREVIIEPRKPKYLPWERFTLNSRATDAVSRMPFIQEMNYFIAEFLRHQKAAELNRVQVSKTGILDPNKLYGYKLVDDIFLVNESLPQGKNHGFVILIDASGSMGPIVKQVVHQVHLLAIFCKRFQIPFKVLAFTNDNGYPTRECNRTEFGNVWLGELFDNKLRDIDIDYRVATLMNNTTVLSSAGTPLSAALSLMPTTLLDFRDEFKVDKLHLICLTDGGDERGAGSGLSYVIDRQTHLRFCTGESFLGSKDHVSALLRLIRDKTGAQTSNFHFYHGNHGCVHDKIPTTINKAVATFEDIAGLDMLFLVNADEVFRMDRTSTTNNMFLVKKLAGFLG